MNKTLLVPLILLSAGPFALAGKGGHVDAAASDDAATAAKLMFGEGLTITASGDSVSIAYDPASGLDDARVSALYATYILPTVQQDLPLYFFHNDSQIEMVDYRPTMQQGGQAFELREPALRAAICADIASHVAGASARKHLQDWCWWQGARTARYSAHEFRGQPVTSHVTGFYDGTLQPGDALPTTGFVLVVPGVERPIDIHPMRVQQTLLDGIAADSDFKADAQKLHDTNQVWVTAQQKKVRALQMKQAGKGNKIVFGERFFSDLDPVPAITSADSCASVYWEGFATKKKAGAIFSWQMAVDGQVCKSDWFQGGWDIADGPFWEGPGGKNCTSLVAAPGAHTLSVSLYLMKGSKTGNKQVTWDGDRATISDQIAYHGKAIAKGSLRCTTGDGT